MRLKMIIFWLVALLTLTFIGWVNAGILFEDDFEEKSIDMGKWKPSQTWDIKNGVLEILDNVSDGSSGAAWGFGSKRFTDFICQMDLQMLSEPASERLDILFRADGEENIYSAQLVPNGFPTAAKNHILWYRRNGGRETWKKQKSTKLPFELKMDSWYQVRLVVEGFSFEFFIRGENTEGYEMVGTWEDDKALHAEGTIGFRTNRLTHVQIDNLIIFESMQDLSVSPKERLATTWGKIKRVFNSKKTSF